MATTASIPVLYGANDVDGSEDSTVALSIPGQPMVTSRIDVLQGIDWVAVYVDRALIIGWGLTMARTVNEATYATALRYAVDLHLLEVASL